MRILESTKIFLESLNSKWKYIAKNKNGEVYVFTDKPSRPKFTDEFIAYVGNHREKLDFLFKKELFDFLSGKDEEPTNIKQLLENCEVIEDE